MPDAVPIEQLSDVEVSSFGVDSATELLNQLKPRTASSMSNQNPIVLINGRVAGSTELDNLPPEAILRVDILPEKAALRYGFNDDQRVVNLILRERFRARVLEALDRQTTEGGGQSSAADASLTRVDHDTEDAVRLDYKESERLLESERGIASAASDLRTLLPLTSEAKLAASIVQPVLDLRPSLEASADVKSSDSLQGLASDNSASAAPSTAQAPTPGDQLLGQHTESTTLHVAGRVSGLWRKLIWSLAVTGNQSSSDQRVNATDIDTPGSMVLDRSDYTLDTGRVDASIGGPLVRLPAGPVAFNAHLDAQLEDVRTHTQSDGEASSQTHLSRTTGSARLRAEVPLTSPALDVLPFAGELTARLSVGVDDVSNFGVLDTYAYGLTWSPHDHVYLNADFTDIEIAPSAQDLFSPAVVTPGVQMFDFVTSQTDYVTQITGGDPELQHTDRRVVRLGMFLGPFFAGDTNAYVNFERRRDSDAVGILPPVTAAVESAFPDRFVRDAIGTLIQVDDRSVNLALEARDLLTWGVNLGLPFSRPQGAPPGLHFMLSLQDTWYVRDTILVANGVPELDLLNGAPLGAVSGGVAGAQPRNTLQLWATLSYRALGAQLFGRWRSASYVNDGTAAAPDSLSFAALGTLNMRVFADVGRLLRGSGAHGWAKGLRVNLNVVNLLDARERVVDSTGLTPAGFQPGYLDPLGRMVTLSLRKVF